MASYYRNLKAYLLFTLPLLIIFTGVIAYPALQTLFRSFTYWDGLNTPVFVGVDNFKKLFSSNDFKISFTNGLKYSLFIMIYQLGFASLFANLLNNDKLKGRKFFRTAYFIPVVLSITVVSQMWSAIYHGDYGLINAIFEALGLNYQQFWLYEKDTAIFAVAFVDSWKGMGYHFILIYSGLRGVDTSYYEAAMIDGANKWKQFTKITLPLMAPTYKISMTLTLTWGFRAFDALHIMTKGGPGNASYTMPQLVFKGVFQLGNYGYASATAVVLLVQCLIVMFLLDAAFKKSKYN